MLKSIHPFIHFKASCCEAPVLHCAALLLKMTIKSYTSFLSDMILPELRNR